MSLEQSITDLLRKLPLFADLPETQLDLLVAESSYDRYTENQVIFYQGDPCERVYIVISGQVKIVYHDRDGREVILEMIAPGEAFGGAVLFFPFHPATAMAMEDSVISSFSASVYAQRVIQDPRTTLKLLHMLGTRHLSMINMQIMAGERVERRMAHILLKLASRVGRETEEGILITIPLSRQDLADMACTTLETSIRTLSRFRKEDLISSKRGGYLVVKDRQRLENLSS